MWKRDVESLLISSCFEVAVEGDKIIMDGNKKAKIYGAIALIFFIIFIFLILVISLLTGTSIRADDSIGMMIVTIVTIFFYLGIIFPIIFTILAVYTYFKYRKKTAPINNAVKVLYERYAKGEISKEELDKMRKEIEN